MSRRPTAQPPRADCPALRHDTAYAYRRYGCRCPAARAIMSHRWARHRSVQQRPRGTQRPGRAGAGTVVDETRVREAVAGLPVALNPLELAAAIAALDDGHRTNRQIARRLGCTERTVQRHRANRREPSCPTRSP